MKAWLFALAALTLINSARAQDLRFDGMLDLRLFHPSDQLSNLNGGLGKTERGSSVAPSAAGIDLQALTLRGSAGITPEFRLFGEVRSDPQQKNAIDIIDAYAVWRPVSTSRWRWSVKGGAFFAPISLENDGIGWTPTWTLTPSAINSWVGDELRTIGTEGKLEWRGDEDLIEATAAVYGVNEPAGVALDEHGWTFHGSALGLFDHIRLSDFGPGRRQSAPNYSNDFRQLDHTPGWYLALAWERPEIGRLQLLRYDNMADPAADDHHDFAWRTKFWSLGYSTEVGELIILAQAMMGSTEIAPPSVTSTTYFYAGYVLLGYEHQDWRYAVRFDQFGTDRVQPNPAFGASEHGMALTTAITWSPKKWLRITGELLQVDSWRAQRLRFGRSPLALETQAQLAVRVLF